VLLLQTGSVLLLRGVLLQEPEIGWTVPWEGAAMTLALAILCAMHGLIHLLGATKGFRLSTAGGALWLIGGSLFFLTAVALVAWPRGWWAIGAVALLISVIAIVPAWSDAKFGMLPNALIFAAVVAGFMAEGPASLHAAYDRDVREGASRDTFVRLVSDEDLIGLPPQIQRYLRLAGVVGQPEVRDFQVRMHGRIRRDRNLPWMPLVSEQHNFVDVPSRFFYMSSSMFAIPVRGYHRYAGGAATMKVKAGGLVTVASASGTEMTEAETVTLFNDMAVMAPATLIDPAIRWETLSTCKARATFTAGKQTIHADLVFSDTGELVNFISDDRYQSGGDGQAMRKLRWSTPVGGYRTFGNVRLASTGAGRWHDAQGAYSYIELTIDDVRYNVSGR
jgi:hypothetical protein